MAVTQAGAELSEAHRVGQLVVRSQLIEELAAIWPLFDPEDIGGSWAQVEDLAVPAIRRSAGVSSGLASAYFGEFRQVEGVSGATPVGAPPLEDIAQATRNLRAAVPVEARRLSRLGRNNVAQVSFVNLSGEASRQALNGGRSTIDYLVQQDGQALGWIRKTDNDPCAFCAMLAGRGPVYKSAASAVTGTAYSETVGGFRAHAHCACQPEAVYSSTTQWPGRAREFKELWRASTPGLSGKDALNAFRRALS